MGFQVPRKTARLVFEGDEFEGLEIVCALDLSFAEQQTLKEMQASGDEASGEDQRKVLDFFAERCITSWNLEDKDGKTLPVSGDSFWQFPGWFGMKVLNGWAEAVKKASEVDAPLGEPSKNGSLSEEDAETMAASSTALKS